MGKIATIITKIREMATSEDFIAKHKEHKQFFTRKHHKIEPADVIFFILSLIKTTLDFEILHYCNQCEMQDVVASSITKARKKISFTAFEELLDFMAKNIEATNKFKGYRVLAIDGMQGEMQRTPELMDKYNRNNASYPMFHAVAVFDVLNKIFLAATFLPAPTDERKAAIDLLKKLSDDNKEIITVDRGFPSLALIQQFEKSGKKFVMRVSKSFLKEVNEFTQSDKTDETRHIDYNKRRSATNKVNNVILPYSFDLRCVKIFLSSGEIETLVTNLSDDEFNSSEIGELYNLRWRIETSYNHLKNAVYVEDFVGVLENSILQEFYATLLIYNLSILFKNEAQEIYEKKTETNKICACYKPY